MKCSANLGFWKRARVNMKCSIYTMYFPGPTKIKPPKYSHVWAGSLDFLTSHPFPFVSNRKQNDYFADIFHKSTFFGSLSKEKC